MAREKKQRIELGGAGGGLNDALASALGGIDPGGLPPGTPPDPEPPQPAAARRKGRVVLRREKAHRGGKVVVVVGDFDGNIPDDEIEALGRRLRKSCGTGGTVRGREIEIQGEKAAEVRTFLQEAGFRVAGV